MPPRVVRRLSDRLSRVSPFRIFAATGLMGMVAIAGASLVASQRAGESEAVAEVRSLTQVIAKTVVEPNLSPELLRGDPRAIEQLNDVVMSRVIDDTTVRVKLWDASGRIVYSDEPHLIGEVYELGEDKSASLWSGEVVSEVSSLDGPENRFEIEAADELLEVYLPLDGPGDEPLLYESYFATSRANESASRIRAEFAPIVLAAVGLMGLMHLGLAWGLSRRMRRTQAEREQLLQHAIDSSDLERRRIAGDLHDGVVQDLVGASFAVSAAAESAGRSAPDLAGDLRAASVSTRRSLQSLRSLLVDIYPPNLHEHGLEAALGDLLAPAASLDIETDLSVEGDVDAEPDAVALVYRVAQEAVRNIMRHADASSISIDVTGQPDHLAATVQDDGRGFSAADATANGHLGLRLLTDLTADAGATFIIDSKPGDGTTIKLEVPT